MYALFSFRNITMFIVYVMVVFGATFLTFQAEDRWPYIFSPTSQMHEVRTFVKTLAYLSDIDMRPEDRFLAAVGSIGFVRKSTGEALPDTKFAESVPVLLYHGITDRPGEYNETPKDFFSHMKTLYDSGYRTITLKQFNDFIDGKTQVPDKSFLLTFDDARLDSIVNGDPILRALDFNAVMFIPTANVLDRVEDSRGYYFNSDLLKNMLASGRWEIGSHAVQESGGFVPVDLTGLYANFLSNKKWIPELGRVETDEEYVARVEQELSQSRSDLEKFTGHTVDTFSYPFSDYGNQSINNSDLAPRTIYADLARYYSKAFRQVSPLDGLFISNYPSDDPYMLKRIEPGPDWTETQLLAYIESSRAKDLPFADDFSAQNGWKRTWGRAEKIDGGLEVYAGENTTGGLSILDGSYLWRDYMYTAVVSLDTGSHISLVARYRDNHNYAMCTFSDTRVDVTAVVGGIQMKVLSIKNPVTMINGPITVGIGVQGSDVDCYIGETLVASANSALPDMLDHGGIGVQVWDAERDMAKGSILAVKTVDSMYTDQLLADLPKYKKKTAPHFASASNVRAGDDYDLDPLNVPEEELSNTISATLPYTFDPRLFRVDAPPFGWTTGFGEIKILDVASSSIKVMNLTSASSTTGALTYSTGGFTWKDYSIGATIDRISSDSLALVGRYMNSRNYVMCNFFGKGERVKIATMKDGELVNMAVSPDLRRGLTASLFSDITEDTNIGMRVRGDEVTCSIKGVDVVRAPIWDLPDVGTVGIKVYDRDVGEGSIYIRKFEVEEIK